MIISVSALLVIKKINIKNVYDINKLNNQGFFNSQVKCPRKLLGGAIIYLKIIILLPN